MIKNLTLFFLLFIAFGKTIAQGKWSSARGEVLMDGMDPTTYFKGYPQKGKEKYRTVIEGRIILFVNLENRALFEDNTTKYLPLFGGWAANGLSEELYIQPDYNNFIILENQLCFFSVKTYLVNKVEWSQSPTYKARAQAVYEKNF